MNIKKVTATALVVGAAWWPQVHSAPQAHTFKHFTGVQGQGWVRVTQTDADVLAEGGTPNADTRRWEWCATNGQKVVCPDGFTYDWETGRWLR